MGGCTGLVLLVLVTVSSGVEERWSRQAGSERRQGDWVPLSCANCHPIDQAPQGTDGLPSVLTPPPRAEGARLLPPPPPPDGLLQQAATGFIEAYNQQQRRPQQFLTETKAQPSNRPQSQFLTSPQKQFVPEPSVNFQPPQQFGQHEFSEQFNEQQSSRQPQQLQFNHEFPESNPYLNQPLLLSPQFVGAPFFPPPSFAQNIQPINPVPLQPIAPISAFAAPINKETFQVPADRPSFTQQITSGSLLPPSGTQLEIQSEQALSSQTSTQSQGSKLEYTVNQTEIKQNTEDTDEVQLLYVPVETLNQRARNLGRHKSLENTQQKVLSNQLAGRQSIKLTSTTENQEYSTEEPSSENQDRFNHKKHLLKQHHNAQQPAQFEQQLPLEDQVKFNSQIHTVRQQFVNQDNQFQQLPPTEQNIFNPQTHFRHQFVDQNSQVQQLPIDQDKFNSQTHNVRQQNVDHNNQFQQLPISQATSNSQTQNVRQHHVDQNNQFQQPPNSQATSISQTHNVRQQHVDHNNQFQQLQSSQDTPNSNKHNLRQQHVDKNYQFQQLPSSQATSNPQTHNVRQQHSDQNNRFQQLPSGQATSNPQTHNVRQHHVAQNNQFQQLRSGQATSNPQTHNVRQQHADQNNQFQQIPNNQEQFNSQTLNVKQQLLDQINEFHQPTDKEQFHSETHNVKEQLVDQNNHFKQLPTDQDKFNSQTYNVRQQFVQSDGRFPQAYEDHHNIKTDVDNTKDQYNFKQNTQPQNQYQNQQIGHFQQQPNFESPETKYSNVQNLNQNYVNNVHLNVQEDQANIQGFNVDHQFTTHQPANKLQPQPAPADQSNIQYQDIKANVNTQIPQLQVQQPAVNQQPYIDEPIQIDQAFTTEQEQGQQTFPHEEYKLSETPKQTISPATQTAAPEVYTTQTSKRQRFRNPQYTQTRNLQQSTQRRFPHDYIQTTVDTLNQPLVSTTTEGTTQINSVRQSWRNTKSQYNRQGSQVQPVAQGLKQYQSNTEQPSLPPPTISSLYNTQSTPVANQPPLSVYMETKGDSMVNDVLRLLKNAKTIQVLDAFGPDSPQVFVGPSNLNAPLGYVKFELPYLNALDNNRVERKVDKLPFFVAPLNFNPPPGYSKIPFPAPHIGSVVISNATVLQTALHEKTREFEPVIASSSERYLDQYTLPAQISPISPQLPSLINSLQDDIYSESLSTTFPSTLPETTTVQTTQFRGRGSTRGSQRGSSEYQTSPTPTRRPHSRTRRPWDGRPQTRRQPTTTSTTLEPPGEPTVQHFTSRPEQPAYNTESYNFQNTAAPGHNQPEINQPQTDDSGAIFKQSEENKYYQNQFISTHQNTAPAQISYTPQFQQVVGARDTQNKQEYYENPQASLETYAPIQESVQTTTNPSVTSSTIQQEDQTFKSQRAGGSRRDPSRHHQRFRSRQRLTTTTTTENYGEPVESLDQYNVQVDSQNNYRQNEPIRNRHRVPNKQRLVENTHFQANVPVNRHTIQTERSDVDIQTTERLSPAHINDHLEQKSFSDNGYFAGHHIHQPSTSQDAQSSNFQDQKNYQLQQHHEQPPPQPVNNLNQNYKNINLQPVQQNNQAQYSIDQLQNTNDQTQSQVPLQSDLQQYKGSDGQTQQVNQNYLNHKDNHKQAHPNTNDFSSDERAVIQDYMQGQQNYFAPPIQKTTQEGDNFSPEQIHLSNVQHLANDQSHFLANQENLDSSNINLGQQILSPQYISQGLVPDPPSPQETAHTQEAEVSHPQAIHEPEVPGNQLRLLKYNKLHSRRPTGSDTLLNDENNRQLQNHYQALGDSSDISTSTTEASTTASLVRVRGRVRGRQRAPLRNTHTTTEAPNYPTTYISRQRNSQENEESQEYSPKKRFNYNSRQTYKTEKTPKEKVPEESSTEKEYDSSERYISSERYPDNSEIITTTTTETPTTKITRRYQHILNRNKVRRTRPTESTPNSGSSGTTKFLVPTTPPPVTRLPSTRGRIRKPISVKATTTTTEIPQVNPKWHEKDTFAPSAGSNEILEPLYQTKDKPQQFFGFQQTPTIQNLPIKTSPKPIIAPSKDESDYWNRGITIQQSTSFDFKPEFEEVTPPSFQADNDKFQGTFSPIWNGQIELQDGNYYDVFRQQQIAKQINDQIPFSSDQQKVVYRETKNGQVIGKENQYSEKTDDVSAVETEEDSSQSERVFPVYREIIRPAETIRDETSQVFSDNFEDQNKDIHEKDTDFSESVKATNIEETVKNDEESEKKDESPKHKFLASHPDKKSGKKRGSWVRVRVRKPQDMFETAESQNLGSVSENAIPAVTKTSASTIEWSPGPSTEQTQQTTGSSEPAETINFEEALKDMLKDFITSEEEANTEISVNNNTTSTSEDDKIKIVREEAEQIMDNKQEYAGETRTEITETEDEVLNEKLDRDLVKTATPELTSEVLTQQPTTILQAPEIIETTIEPEHTTTFNELEYKSPPNRVLGTSTTTEISLETEICYRGRCVKTKKASRDSESDLLPME